LENSQQNQIEDAEQANRHKIIKDLDETDPRLGTIARAVDILITKDKGREFLTAIRLKNERDHLLKMSMYLLEKATALSIQCDMTRDKNDDSMSQADQIDICKTMDAFVKHMHDAIRDMKEPPCVFVDDKEIVLGLEHFFKDKYHPVWEHQEETPDDLKPKREYNGENQNG
jgi:hypothetical protein